jgi:hypothetical protein
MVLYISLTVYAVICWGPKYTYKIGNMALWALQQLLALSYILYITSMYVPDTSHTYLALSCTLVAALLQCFTHSFIPYYTFPNPYSFE